MDKSAPTSGSAAISTSAREGSSPGTGGSLEYAYSKLAAVPDLSNFRSGCLTWEARPPTKDCSETDPFSAAPMRLMSVQALPGLRAPWLPPSTFERDSPIMWQVRARLQVNEKPDAKH
ncbi:hypothetical protein NDU88_010861 [Pleurodeles waltl]|uniref:Uncharacterized protein n=1 Tax=Pleurodeles waltl TaxID=8319 RepID=A0AAV7S2F2_PLEWA|nr:hypothetical protein NDU88_010861 [Pleurodeles waltl]